jgi:diaminopimelate epimerase
MTDVPVAKYHGTGNDFLVVDAEERVPDRRAFAREHCDRDTGISHPDSDRVGADGVLFCALEDDYDPPRVVMTIVQPDGSTAAMCGNGARCAAEWAMERTGSDVVMLDTLAGTRRAERVGEGEIAVEMGDPSFDPAVVPLDRDDPLVEEPLAGYEVTGVNTGVPHAVVFVDDVDAVDLAADAPPIRHADVFPAGANVTFAEETSEGYRQRTFERGVEAETASCGTGAVAIAVVARHLDRLAEEPVRVSPPGGDLSVGLPDDGAPVLHGPVAFEYETTAAACEPTHVDARADGSGAVADGSGAVTDDGSAVADGGAAVADDSDAVADGGRDHADPAAEGDD